MRFCYTTSKVMPVCVVMSKCSLYECVYIYVFERERKWEWVRNVHMIISWLLSFFPHSQHPWWCDQVTVTWVFLALCFKAVKKWCQETVLFSGVGQLTSRTIFFTRFQLLAFVLVVILKLYITVCFLVSFLFKHKRSSRNLSLDDDP